MSTNRNPVTEVFTTGKFIKECPNRFRCLVDIAGTAEMCYVASSCRLEPLVDLSKKEVLLLPTVSNKSPYRYTLAAVKYGRSYIVLNSSLANAVVKQNIQSRRFSYLGPRQEIVQEHYVGDYKSDLYIPSTDTIIEIKSIITDKKTATFPAVNTQRGISQLEKIQRLLKDGKNVVYLLISLNPYLGSITISSSSPFFSELEKCLHLGMTIKAYTCKLQHTGTLMINKEIPLLLP